MSGLLERGRLTVLEHATRPVLSPSHVDPNELDAATPHKPPHPTTTENERVWRDGRDAMTYNAWLSNEKELDHSFRIWRDTDDGRREVAEVYNRFPGLRLTSMGAEDVSWFVREMSTPGTYLRTTWDAVSNDGNTKPRFCVAQLMLLMLLILLTSPQRPLCIDGMGENPEELFPFYREAPWWGKLYGDFYVGGPGLTDGYDCLFPTGVISKAKFSAGLRDRRLPQAVEGITILFRRYRNEPLYCDAPPYISKKPRVSRKDREGIFEHLDLFQGPVLMALDDTRLDDLPKAFRCRFILPSDRIHIKGEADTDLDKHNMPQTRIPMILGLRRVCRVWSEMVQDVFFQNTFVFWYDNHMLEDSRSQNVWAISTSVREDRYNLVDFKVRYKPILKDGLAQPFVSSDEIGFEYEEVVHLGASHNTGRIIFDTDAPCDRTFVNKWINNQLFLDDGGHLAVRAFRLNLDPGTHTRELSRQWLSGIFQHLHKRGIVGRETGSDTLLLDWNARDL